MCLAGQLERHGGGRTISKTEDDPDVLEVKTEEFREPEGEWEREEAQDGEVLLIHEVEESDDF